MGHTRKVLVLITMTMLGMVLLLPMPAIAQQQKFYVYVNATAQDGLGQQLIYELREKIGASSHLAEADSQEKSLFQLHVVTLDPGSPNPYGQQVTVYSVVLSGSQLDGSPGKLLLDQWVGTCGNQRISECASTIIASADNDMTPIVQTLRSQSPPKGK